MALFCKLSSEYVSFFLFLFEKFEGDGGNDFQSLPDGMLRAQDLLESLPRGDESIVPVADNCGGIVHDRNSLLRLMLDSTAVEEDGLAGFVIRIHYGEAAECS